MNRFPHYHKEYAMDNSRTTALLRFKMREVFKNIKFIPYTTYQTDNVETVQTDNVETVQGVDRKDE